MAQVPERKSEHRELPARSRMSTSSHRMATSSAVDASTCETMGGTARMCLRLLFQGFSRGGRSRDQGACFSPADGVAVPTAVAQDLDSDRILASLAPILGPERSRAEEAELAQIAPVTPELRHRAHIRAGRTKVPPPPILEHPFSGIFVCSTPPSIAGRPLLLGRELVGARTDGLGGILREPRGSAG